MKKLKTFRNNTAAFLLVFGLALQAKASDGGPFELTKSLWGVPGNPAIENNTYSTGFAAGEPLCGYDVAASTFAIRSGYYASRFGVTGTLQVLGVHFTPEGFRMGDIPVGISPNAQIEIQFNDPLDEATIARGLTLTAIRDAMGRSVQTPITFEWTHYAETKTLVLSRPRGWSGNTLIDIALTPALQNAYSGPLQATTHILFLTMLDPHQENQVLYPIQVDGNGILGRQEGLFPAMQIRIPAETLNDYAAILVSNTPQSIDPGLLNQASANTSAQSGYRVPVLLQEISAYDRQGNRMHSLAKRADMTVSFQSQNGLIPGLGVPVRAASLSFWTLDAARRMWVMMPDSRVDTSRQTISAPLSQFTVFAVIGNADGNASSTFVFPNPWRPFGPHAGEGPGQTGSAAGGLTFNQIPSECRIRIYTLSGQLVRELHHSDLTGAIAQERWDGKTTHGAPAASGVYLWRVESDSDAKNGKLMIIR